MRPETVARWATRLLPLDVASGRVRVPSVGEIGSMVSDGETWAACRDECPVDPDGVCQQHGAPSWLSLFETGGINEIIINGGT